MSSTLTPDSPPAARMPEIIRRLRQAHPDACCALVHRNPWELAIRSTGFYRNKAKHIQEAAQIVAYEYGGEVPATMDELLKLPGVARKTANVVLGVAFHIADGIVVDTHVKRLANRLGLSKAKDPRKIEKDLMAIVPRSEWIDLGHLLIFHGRRVCKARKPDCAACTLNDLCPGSELTTS